MLVASENVQVETWLSYHAITFTKTSTISGSGGASVALNLHYDGAQSYILNPGEKVATASRTGNGTVAVSWYDDTENYYLAAREDATHVGRSNTFTFA
jgi:hypothetical protein